MAEKKDPQNCEFRELCSLAYHQSAEDPQQPFPAIITSSWNGCRIVSAPPNLAWYVYWSKFILYSNLAASESLSPSDNRNFSNSPEWAVWAQSSLPNPSSSFPLHYVVETIDKESIPKNWSERPLVGLFCPSFRWRSAVCNYVWSMANGHANSRFQVSFSQTLCDVLNWRSGHKSSLCATAIDAGIDQGPSKLLLRLLLLLLTGCPCMFVAGRNDWRTADG